MMCFGLKDRKRAKTNHCVIVLLDDTQLVHELHASSTGQDLLDVVIKHLNLIETSYFGLKYLDSSSKHNDSSNSSSSSKHHRQSRPMEQIWLNVDKSAIKQLRDVQPMTVYFGVKYYASDPCKLAEEITRYQFFLQCKQDILHARLPITFDLAIELFALAVQSELGDYDPQRHHDGYVSEFQFLLNQSVELEKRVALYHRQLTGQVPATAELNFLKRVKWLDLYGCELHPIQYEDNNSDEYALGLNPSGVLVLRNKLKVAHYLWPRIEKTKSQGRCFLMDVIETSGNNKASGRNRFGFRLADKAASRRLRQAVDEHKSFFTLVNNSATLNQLAQRQQQQQQMKLSQRFRNSIRSAINIGPFGGFHQQQQAEMMQQQQQLQQQQSLRSSMKSLANQQMHHAAMMQGQYPLDARAPPTVVRMPSRRYSNKSGQGGPYCTLTASAANGNGLPAQPSNKAISGSGAHTMVDSQRQQALLLMNQFNQMNGMIGKSQTLKPMPAAGKLDSKEAKKNPYYQQMMMMAMMQAQQQQNGGSRGGGQQDVAIVPPGRHVVQPSIYKASSVVNGINQLGTAAQQKQAGAMMQFFNTQPQYPHQYRSGHESPRSTKSAIGPGSAMKLASKKLAKQQLLLQQQMLYHDSQPQDVRPLLAYDMIGGGSGQQQYPPPTPAEYYGVSGPQGGGGYMMSTSANASPRSVRSNRLTSSRHKSKSTNENLNLLHHNNNNNKYMQAQLLQQAAGQQPGKMLLATTQQLMQHQMQLAAAGHHPMGPPPPGYHHAASGKQGRHMLQGCSDNESDVSKMSKRSAAASQHKKRATFALDNDQANLLLNTNGLVVAGGAMKPNDPDDDYCCSRSDCSSIDDGGCGGQQRSVKTTTSGQGAQILASSQRRQRRSSTSGNKQHPAAGDEMYQQHRQRQIIDDHQEWNAIRRRHNEFLLNGSFAGQQPSQDSPLLADGCSDGQGVRMLRRQPSYEDHDNDPNNNNNNSTGGGSQLVKNIANKQATPILLSMNYDQGNTNNKAIQLLNLQRQQLNSQSSDGTKSSSSVVDSANSSVASSPQALSGGGGVSSAGQQQQSALKSIKTTDSTASSSTTSGYYAGSNSTGSASIDSDSQTMGDNNNRQNTLGPGGKHSNNGGGQAKLSGNRYQGQGGQAKAGYQQPAFNEHWHEEGSRAKIALGAYVSRMPPSSGTNRQQQPNNGISSGNHHLKNNNTDSPRGQAANNNNNNKSQKHQQFYMGDANNGNNSEDGCRANQSLPPAQGSDLNQQWSPLNQIQQHAPSSLKYVSFDV